MEQFTDKQLVVLWHLTNLAPRDKAKVLPPPITSIAIGVNIPLWNLFDEEIEARGIDPQNLTKTIIITTKENI